jgi:hypothetical protein
LADGVITVAAAITTTAWIVRITSHTPGRTPAPTERQADPEAADRRLSRFIGLTWRIGEQQNASSTGVSPTYESSGFEPPPFERDAEAASPVARRSPGFTDVIVDDVTVAHQ